MPNYTKKRNRSGRKGRGFSQRMLDRLRSLLPGSSKHQYMPIIEVPLKTNKELQTERINGLVARNIWHPKTVPAHLRSMLPLSMKPHSKTKKRPRKLQRSKSSASSASSAI
jgi:hypothetical protein